MNRPSAGFTLIELIAVLVIIGILGVSSVRSALPTLSFQMQSSRDQIVTAFFLAQQRAMAQANPVRLFVNAPNQIDLREDTDGDGSFSDESSLALGGVSYPISLLSSQSVNAATFDFDRFGATSATTLVLSQDGSSVNITVTATGYVF